MEVDEEICGGVVVPYWNNLVKPVQRVGESSGGNDTGTELPPKTGEDIVYIFIDTDPWVGYSKDLPFEQRLRDTIGEEIGDGTAEVMKLIITREILGREFLPY